MLQIGNSLITLTISHGLKIHDLPYIPFKVLTNLQYLDLSNNKITDMAEVSFHFLKNIRQIKLQDNEIGMIKKGTFQV